MLLAVFAHRDLRLRHAADDRWPGESRSRQLRRIIRRLAGWWRRWWWWFGRRWRSENWHGDRRQPWNLHNRRTYLRREARRTLVRRWRRWCRWNPVADVDRDDRPREGLTARRRADHGPIRRRAVHRCRLVGDLEAGFLEALTRRIQFQPRHTGHPSARRALDITGIGRRQMQLTEIKGNRLHRLKPRAGRLVAAVQITAAARTQREGTDAGRIAGVGEDVVRRGIAIGEAHEARRPMRLSGAGLA